jgi:hypothetical protein
VSQKHEPRANCQLLNLTSLPRVAITRGDATRDAQRHQMSSSRASLHWGARNLLRNRLAVAWMTSEVTEGGA